jgi:hypothetical protein
MSRLRVYSAKWRVLRIGANGWRAATAFVHRNADHREALRAVRPSEVGKPGDFLFASVTPGGPEIKENDFATVVLQSYRIAGTVFQCKNRRGLPFICGVQDGSDRRLIGSCGDACQREQQGRSTNQMDSIYQHVHGNPTAAGAAQFRLRPSTQPANLIRGRSLRMIDDENFDRALGRHELQSELFL